MIVKYSNQSIFVTADKPSTPKDLHMTEQNIKHITVAWEEPESDGGSRITGYIIEKRDSNRTQWSRVTEDGADARSCKVSKLVEGNEYYFRVAAVNIIGQGPFATTEEGIKAKLPFGE
jgi:titin